MTVFSGGGALSNTLCTKNHFSRERSSLPGTKWIPLVAAVLGHSFWKMAKSYIPDLQLIFIKCFSSLSLILKTIFLSNLIVNSFFSNFLETKS